MVEGNGYVSLATGTRVSAHDGAPNLMDMAYAIGRLCRWCGGGDHYYPVMLHTFMVADLVPDRIKIYAHLHDAAPECVGNDVPKPVKTNERSEMEDAIFERTLVAHGIPLPTASEWRLVKEADGFAKVAEAWVVGNEGHRRTYARGDESHENLVRHYMDIYPVEDLVSRSGRSVNRFVSRYNLYKCLRINSL